MTDDGRFLRDLFGLSGRVAVVTGGSGALGGALALAKRLDPDTSRAI